MAYHGERPREALGPSIRPAPADLVALDAAAAIERTRRQARLDQARDRFDVRHRPEDSSPGIRRMLGNDGPPRPPRRWTQAVAWGEDGVRLRNVDAGPVAPAPARPRRG